VTERPDKERPSLGDLLAYMAMHSREKLSDPVRRPELQIGHASGQIEHDRVLCSQISLPGLGRPVSSQEQFHRKRSLCDTSQ
jgi:hypothetical protein